MKLQRLGLQVEEESEKNQLSSKDPLRAGSALPESGVFPFNSHVSKPFPGEISLVVVL